MADGGDVMELNELSNNAILGKLPEVEIEQLARRMEITEAKLRDQLYQAGEPITQVIFPLTSIFSMVGSAGSGSVVEVATVGREGMIGLPVFLGAMTSPHAAFCQIEGRVATVPADHLRQVLTGDGALRAALGRFAQATMVQMAQNVVCNNSHPASQRAARWLLTTRDRVGGNDFLLTQEFLGQMLGVSRPTVSATASQLQARGLIEYRRGKITITDPEGLENTACQCYEIVRAEFDAIT
jgi:CRP-like cAMP-binding protein